MDYWGSLMCVRDRSCACVHIHTGVALTDSRSAQHQFLTLKNSRFFLVLLPRFEPRAIGSGVRRSTNWATLSPRYIPTGVSSVIAGKIPASCLKVMILFFCHFWRRANIRLLLTLSRANKPTSRSHIRSVSDKRFLCDRLRVIHRPFNALVCLFIYLFIEGLYARRQPHRVISGLLMR